MSPEDLIISSDCGFGRQGCNRDIAFFKTTAIAQGANIVRRELGLPERPVPAADPRLQTDIVPPGPQVRGRAWRTFWMSALWMAR